MPFSGWKHFKPDIVIIDVDIPGVNGIQVLETLRKRQYSGIIIIVSAKNDHFYGKHCADAGANGFVSKKEGMNNIIAAIEAAKNGYCYFPFSLNRFVGSLTSDQQKLDSYRNKEISVMRYILDGKDNNDIAEKMFISNKTVSTYKKSLDGKIRMQITDGSLHSHNVTKSANHMKFFTLYFSSLLWSLVDHKFRRRRLHRISWHQ